jgi:hypothetical protein
MLYMIRFAVGQSQALSFLVTLAPLCGMCVETDGWTNKRTIDWKNGKRIDVPFVAEPKQSDVCANASPTHNAFINK